MQVIPGIVTRGLHEQQSGTAVIYSLEVTIMSGACFSIALDLGCSKHRVLRYPSVDLRTNTLRCEINNTQYGVGVNSS